MAKKLIHTTPEGVKVYRDSEWEQFIVIPAGMKPSDDDAPFYFTDDKEDALSTAKIMGRKENPTKKHPGHRAIYTVREWNRERNTTYGNAMFSFIVEDESGTRHSGKTKPNYDFVIGLPMLYPGDKIDAIIETTPSGRVYMTDAEIIRGKNPVRPLKSSAKYITRPSQATKKTPTKRLKARRQKAVKAPKGYFPNPIKGTKTTPLFVVSVKHEGERYYYGGSKRDGSPIFDSDIRKAFFAFGETPLRQHVTVELQAHAKAKGLKLELTGVEVAGGEIIPHG